MLPIRIGIFRDLKSQKVHFFGLPDYRTTFLFKQGDPKQLEKQENSKGRSSPEDTELPWATKTKHTSFLTQGTNIVDTRYKHRSGNPPCKKERTNNFLPKAQV